MRLYQRGRVWWVEYQTQYKQCRHSTGCTDKRAATVWMRQLKAAMTMPTFEKAVEILRMYYDKPAEGVLPLELAWQTYHDLAKATGKISISQKTLTYRKREVDALLAWLKKNRPTISTVEGVTGPIAAAYVTHLATLGLKSKTRINRIAELGTVWKLLETASAGVKNPWSNLRPQDVDGERGKAFTPAQEKAVLEAAKRVGCNWFEICSLMRITGQRYGDIGRLMWSEISADAIRLTPHKTTRHGIAVVIPMIPQIRKIINSIPKTGDYLFPLHVEMIETHCRGKGLPYFRDVLIAAGLADGGYTVHSWRHTAATRFAAAGVDIETRKRLLGHTVDDTARRYDHDEHLAENRAALEAAITS